MTQVNSNNNKPEKTAPLILMPLPDYGFDPSESAIPWKACSSRGWQVIFSTETGSIPQCDENKLTGPLPGLLTASNTARSAYQQMIHDPSYQHPIPYLDIVPAEFAGLLLPGGDALTTRQYLESTILQSKVLLFWQLKKLIGAICHGVLVLARTHDPQTGDSILYGHKVSALPKTLDRLAYHFDEWLLKRGYIMYPQCVEDEVRTCLEHPGDLADGPSFFTPYVISDDNLVTARWYLDAELFGERFAQMLQQRIIN